MPCPAISTGKQGISVRLSPYAAFLRPHNAPQLVGEYNSPSPSERTQGVRLRDGTSLTLGGIGKEGFSFGYQRMWMACLARQVL